MTVVPGPLYIASRAPPTACAIEWPTAIQGAVVAVRPAAGASLDTSGIVRIVLISAFVVALLLGTTGFYLVLHDRAIHRQTVEAGRLLTTAQAIRNYTDTNVAPALRAAGPDAFHVETVPAFAAQTVYRTVQGVYPGYTYREPALKPTN